MPGLWPVLSLVVTSIIGRAIYRLYFHPLSKFPGPKLASVTHLYEFYYDVVRKGRYLWEIEKMHEQYGENYQRPSGMMIIGSHIHAIAGPIVRITPRELHINDPYFHDHIYASGGRKRNKDPKFIPLFSAPLSMISTVDHEHHRFRRSLLSNFFSKKSVNKITPLIQGKVAVLIDRFEQAYQDGSVVDLTAAFCALAGDIIHHYTYGESLNYIQDKSFENHIHGGILELESVTHLNRFFPFLLPLLQLMPSCLVAYFKPATAAIRKEVTKQSQSVLQRSSRHVSSNKMLTLAAALSAPTIPTEERTLSRLEEEGMILLNGGTESPGNALSVAAFHLYDNKVILRRLQTELLPIMSTRGDSVSLTELEKLPYLVRYLLCI